MPQRRKRRPRPRRPLRSIDRILAWADAFYKRTGKWPRKDAAGLIADTAGEKWLNVDMALRLGLRGLRGGSSLARLLAAKRGVRNLHDLPRLAKPQILAWAEAHRRRLGRWPTRRSGPIADPDGETWNAVDTALQKEQRGLPGGSSLPRLLRSWR